MDLEAEEAVRAPNCRHKTGVGLDQMLWTEPCRFESYPDLQRVIRASDHVRLHRPETQRWAADGASNLATTLSRL